MNVRQLHPWKVSLEEARDIQERLASQVSLANGIPERPQYVAGTDISPPDTSGLWLPRTSRMGQASSSSAFQ